MNDLIASVEKMGVAGDAAMDKALLEGAKIAESAMKNKVYTSVKKRTGDLQSNIKIGEIRESRKGKSIVVGPGKGDISVAYYGKFAEYGTVHQKATPFMRPTFDETKEKVYKKIAEVLHEEIQRAGR